MTAGSPLDAPPVSECERRSASGLALTPGPAWQATSRDTTVRRTNFTAWPIEQQPTGLPPWKLRGAAFLATSSSRCMRLVRVPSGTPYRRTIRTLRIPLGTPDLRTRTVLEAVTMSERIWRMLEAAISQQLATLVWTRQPSAEVQELGEFVRGLTPGCS